MATIDKIREERLKKRARFEKQGINPYPARTNRTHSIREALQRFEELSKNKEEVVLCGRLRLLREHGGVTFIEIEESFSGDPTPAGEENSGRIQAMLKQDGVGRQRYDFFLSNFDVGDFVEVGGVLITTKTGERTIEVDDYRILTKALRPLPEKWHGLEDKEKRYRHRYLDLIMNPEVRKVFRKRTKILRLLREYLDQNGFMEVETPVLQPLYGGASAKPFITHLDSLDLDMYLRISDELYLKRLIVGGLEKVYEVSKDFRNEGIDRQHNPEFTQIEFYWAYADYKKLMEFTEKMLSSVIKRVCGGLKVEYEDTELDFTPPWPRRSYKEVVMEHTGIDIDEANTEEKLKQEITNNWSDWHPGNDVGYGPVLDNLYKEHVRPHLIQPMFLTDHPAQLMPLAKRKEKDPSKIESFQLLVYGYELIKAYSELNDPLDQKERWLEQEGLAKKGLEEHEVLDEEYIEALEYGMPPTAGWGMGIDRFTAILTNQHSIRDVIFFPFMRPK